MNYFKIIEKKFKYNRLQYFCLYQLFITIIFIYISIVVLEELSPLHCFLREQHEENNKKLRKQHANTRQKQLKKKNYIAIILNNKNLNYCFYQIFLIEILINILKNILIIQFKFQITIHIKLRYILICIYYMI